CDRHGVLFIADEVMCGMGRTGTLFAMEAQAVCPDLITVAKGLGAGYQPIAGMMASGRVVAAISAGSGVLANGHTYMSHAVACAGSLAVLRTIEQEDLLANVRRRGTELRSALDHRFGQHPHIGEVRGVGLFQALEVVADRGTKAPFPRSLRVAETLKQAAMDNGLICYPSAGAADGVSGDHVLLAPPYIIDADQVGEIVDRLAASLAQVLPAAS
ncbi:MAG: aminotransferase class III-fold pyridoxal phosphate-dependent enzyme, partial [Nevskiales bacterium]